MVSPVVSVIIPCHNYGIYVGEAIESVQAQSYTNWEVLVIDDGSSDNTATVVKSYSVVDSRVKYHYQDKQGVSKARNLGFSLASGEYIQLLDADDYIEKDKFKLQLLAFEENPKADLIYGDTYLFTHSSDKNELRAFRKFPLANSPISGSGLELATHMVHDNMFLISCPLFKRSVAQKVGGFNENILAFEDWNFWYKFVLQGSLFMYDNRKGTEFYVRTHGNNTTGNKYKMWKYKIISRQFIMNDIRALLNTAEGERAGLQTLLAKHQVLLYEEQARFNALYGNVAASLLNTWRYALHSGKPMASWYDTAYWLKERLLGRHKKTTTR